jgi:predicted MFS family arabinose efflux permease
MAFDQPARRAMIPSIVPRHLVINAMALSSGTMTATRIAGAAGAGLLISVAGFGSVYVAMAVIYVGAVFFTWMLRTPGHERSGYQGVRRMAGDLREGLRFAWITPAVRGVLIISLAYFAFGMAFMQVFAPLFAKQVLDIGDAGFGLMVSVMGVGGLVGAMMVAVINPTRRRGSLMLGILALFGLFLIIFSASAYLHSVVLAFVIMLFLGIGQSTFNPISNAVLMEASPENLRGRVISVLSLDRGMTTFGGATAGFLAAAIGAPLAQIGFGLGCVITAVVMYAAYPALRRIE